MKSILQILFALALTFLILRPLFGNLWYPMHDTTHVARLYLMENAIRSGQFPPVWAEGINHGFGYPLFHFYAPLFYYLALVLKQFAGSYVLALKITLGLFLAIGSLGVMQLVRRWGRGAMFLSATLFLTSPYLAVDLYVRGAFAELAALCLLPWIFWGWQELGSRRRRVTAAIVTTLFVTSHNLIPMLAFPFVAIWILIHHYRNLKILILPTILTILLSSFFLFPIFFERSFVQADAIAKTSDYRLHFVQAWQLWNSTWGFGGSAEGVEDGFSFKMGKVQLLLATLGFIFLVIKKNKYWLLSLFAAILLFMSTSFASFVWQSIPLLAIAQFPWRYLALATSLLAVVGSVVITIIPNRFLRLIFGLITISLLLFTNLKYFTPQTTFVANDQDFTNPKYLDTVADIIPEYMPVWVTHRLEPKQSPNDRIYYPTWQVKVDGSFVHTYPDQNGMLAYPQGEKVIITQGHTPLEKIAYFFTIIGIIWSLYLWFKR